MNVLATIAILLSTSLAQSDAEVQGCKTTLNELARAAHAAVLATDTADKAVDGVDQLDTKLESCRKDGGGRAPACAKLEEKLRAAKFELEVAEEALTLALEDVDAAYDEFDVACSWEDPGTHVQVRHGKPQTRAPRQEVRRVREARPSGIASRGR